MKRITAVIVATLVALGFAAQANASHGGNQISNSQYSYSKVLYAHTNGTARYLYPQGTTDYAKSYYVLSGTSVYDFYTDRCYNAGTRVYLYNGHNPRMLSVRQGAC